MNSLPVAAIIAAHNEDQTIRLIVETIVASKLFRDVIVISDGSTDRTVEEAKKGGATMVHSFALKQGKGAAMMYGVAHTDAALLFFCDADLKGLRIEHLQKIIHPVATGRLAMCVGIRDRGRLVMKLSAFMPLIGGERAMVRKVFENISDKFLQGFMVESSINYYCASHHLPYGTVELPGLHIRRKMQKVGFVRGLFEYINMWYQVWTAMVIVRIARLRGEFL
jgi:glycosyltransferase involved in cell wall biosynthesis